MEYQKLTKSAVKVIKQLLEYTSKDQARSNLFCKVKIENGIAASADGFKMAYLRLNDELKEIFKEDGVFIIRDGRIANEPVISIETNTEAFPDLGQVMPKGDVFLRFGVNPRLLIDALKYADTNEPIEFIIHEYPGIKPEMGITNPIELRFSVGECDFNAVIMPMHINNSSTKWSFKNGN